VVELLAVVVSKWFVVKLTVSGDAQTVCPEQLVSPVAVFRFPNAS
jgi:hypothetical protein